MAKARYLKGEQHSVVAVIGDGALTGGMALEALKLYKNTKSESKNLHHALVIESNVNIPKSHK